MVILVIPGEAEMLSSLSSCIHSPSCFLSLEVRCGCRGGFVPAWHEKRNWSLHMRRRSPDCWGDGRTPCVSALPMPTLRTAGRQARCFHWPVRGWHPRGVFLSGKSLSLSLGFGTTLGLGQLWVRAEARFLLLWLLRGTGKRAASVQCIFGCRTCPNHASSPSHSQVNLVFLSFAFTFNAGK